MLPSSSCRRWQVLTDVTFCTVLMLYVLCGASQVPFHGDESSVISMSRDYYSLLHGSGLNRFFFQDVALDREAQELRLANGTVPSYLIGMSCHLSGFAVDHLNKSWVWYRDWNWNVLNGYKPSPELLHAARRPSAFCTAISVAVVFFLGMRWEGSLAAYIAALLTATHPIILLHGRRAMMEGPVLLFSVLVVSVGMSWGVRLAKLSCDVEKNCLGWWALILGLVSGSNSPFYKLILAECGGIRYTFAYE